MASNTQKLRILRARTDHDLLLVISRELDRGLALVDVVSSRNSPFFEKAVRAHDTATVLLPRMTGLSQDDRLRFERRVKELQSRLEQVPLDADARPYFSAGAS